VNAGSSIAGASAAAPVEEIAADRPSGSNPTSSGRRTTKSQVGTKPTSRTAMPTASHPARQPCCCMAKWAIRGSAMRPTIWARFTIELASARRSTNQLFKAP
jgi:hypothetical protein